MLKKITKLALSTTFASLVFPTLSGSAASFNLEFTFASGDNPASSGTGFWTLDDDVLTPNFSGFIDLADVTELSATFINLLGTPNTTTFTPSDLFSFNIATDGNGDLVAIDVTTNTNPDFYTLISTAPASNFVNISGNGEFTDYNIAVEPTTVPESSNRLGWLTLGMLGLAYANKHHLQEK